MTIHNKRKKKNELYSKVETVLEADPESRDDDVRLWIMVARTFYPQYKMKVSMIDPVDGTEHAGVECIKFRDILKLPKQYDVQRYRTHIQNVEKRFLPTKIEVVKARRMNEQVWHLLMKKPDTL